MVVLLAHWCPHCNAEIPVLNEWRDSGEIPDGLNIVGVSTGASADAPNFPPDSGSSTRTGSGQCSPTTPARRRLTATGDGRVRRHVVPDPGVRRRQRDWSSAPVGEVPIEVIAPIAELVDELDPASSAAHD